MIAEITPLAQWAYIVPLGRWRPGSSRSPNLQYRSSPSPLGPKDTDDMKTVAAPFPPDLLTVPEAARRVGVHVDTLYRLVRTGQFPPAVRVGSHWRVSVPKLERYLHGDAA